MKAATCKQFGEPEVLQISNDVPLPKCNNSEEVLIKVEATACNRADLLQRRGKYPPPKEVTDIIGLECVGYLVENESQLKDSNYIKNAKRVMCLVSGGGYAEYCKVNKNHVIEIPHNLSFIEAAAIPEVFLTAYQLLRLVSKANEGESVLIIGAAGGVGTSLIQLCKKFKMKSISVASNNDKLKFCKELGSDYTINYKEHADYSGLVKEFTKGKGVNVILDPVLAQNFDYNMNSLAMDGRWVMYGSMGGVKVENANFAKFLQVRGQIIATTLRSRNDDYKSELVRNFKNECLNDFENGKLKPIIDKVFPLSKVAEAHKYMESNANIGKIILQNDL